MSRSMWTVAKWEFGRYFRLRDQLIGVMSLLVGGCVGIGAVKLSDLNSTATVAVSNLALAPELDKKSDLKLVSSDASIEELKQQVLDKKIEGALVFFDPTSHPNNERSSSSAPFELFVRHEPTWLPELLTALNQANTKLQVSRSGIAPQQLQALFAPVDLKVVSLIESNISKWDRAIALSLLGLMIIASWLGLAYLLTGISGEKQHRVTEQIVSAISPQAWIDGKLLGITAAAIGSTLNLVLTGAASMAIGVAIGFDITLPSSLSRIDLLPWVMFYVIGGVFFWNCFYASIASIINDPNTSARSALIFLPILPMATAATAMAQPDGMWMTSLSLIPGCSSTAMPIRLLLGDVHSAELIVSAVLLVAGILVVRTVAGRIFAAGILLTGKEPSWVEVLRWAISKPQRTI